MGMEVLVKSDVNKYPAIRRFTLILIVAIFVRVINGFHFLCDKLLFMMFVMLEHIASGAILSNLGPIQSRPVAFVTSKLVRNFFTNDMFIIGILNKSFTGTLESTYSFKRLKSEDWTGSGDGAWLLQMPRSYIHKLYS